MRFSRRFAPQNDRVGGWDSHVATLLRMTEWVMGFSRRLVKFNQPPQNDQLKKSRHPEPSFFEGVRISSFRFIHNPSKP
jgi:hypothetical protein